MQIKTLKRYHLIPIRLLFKNNNTPLPKTKTNKKTGVGEDAKKLEDLVPTGWDLSKMIPSLWKTV